MSKFNVGDRVRFTYPDTSHKRGQSLDATVVGVSPFGGYSVRYDTYKPDTVCTPDTRCLSLFDQPVDETESFFV